MAMFLGISLFLSPVYAVEKAERPVVRVTHYNKDAKNRVVTISFDGPITPDTAEAFTIAFTAAEKVNPVAIIVEISTYGGGVDAGWRMARVVERSKIKSICVAENEVASMGVFFLESCSVRAITNRSFLTAHYPFFPSLDSNSAQAFDNSVARVQGMKLGMLMQLAHRAKLTTLQVKAKLDAGDWVLLPVEALSSGEVDLIVDTVEQVQNYLESNGNLPK